MTPVVSLTKISTYNMVSPSFLKNNSSRKLLYFFTSFCPRLCTGGLHGDVYILIPCSKKTRSSLSRVTYSTSLPNYYFPLFFFFARKQRSLETNVTMAKLNTSSCLLNSVLTFYQIRTGSLGSYNLMLTPEKKWLHFYLWCRWIKSTLIVILGLVYLHK